MVVKEKAKKLDRWSKQQGAGIKSLYCCMANQTVGVLPGVTTNDL
jgi:hypothetical protein